jgi:hypothetical protein
LGSNTGRSPKHFRPRRLYFASLGSGFSFCCFFTVFPFLASSNGQGAHLKTLFQTESAGFTQLLTTALRTDLGATLVIGVESHHCKNGLLPLPVASSAGRAPLVSHRQFGGVGGGAVLRHHQIQVAGLGIGGTVKSIW